MPPNHEQLINGKLTSSILKLAWPIMIVLVIQTGFNIIDTIFIGRLGVNDLAAVSLAFPLDYFMILVALGLGLGLTSLVARKIGAQDKVAADNIAEHALLLSFVVALFFAVIGYIFGSRLYSFFSPNLEIRSLMADYMSVLFSGSTFLFFGIFAMAILQGEGDSRTPMKTLLIAIICNIILDPILIYGLFGAPKLGVHGAAIATVMARSIACIFLIWHLFIKNKSYISFNYRDFRWQIRIVKEIFSLGLPATLSQISSSIGIMFMNKLVVYFGAVALAAYGIGFKIDSLALLPIFGFSSAAITLVGLQAGAGRLEMAKQVIPKVIKLITVFLIPISLLFLIFSKYIVWIFTSDINVIKAGAEYLKVTAPMYFFIAVTLIVASGFLGLGRGIVSFSLNALRAVVLSLFFAWLLAIPLGLGIIGVWLGMALAFVITAGISWFWWRRGESSFARHLGSPSPPSV